MMRKYLRFWIVLYFLGLFILPARAETYIYDGGEADELEQAWEGLLEALPKEIREEAAGLNPTAEDTAGWEEMLTVGYWKNKLTGLVNNGFRSALNSLSAIWGVLLLTAVCRQMADGPLTNTFGFCSDLCMALTVFSSTRSVLLMIQTFLSQLCTMMTAMVPVMAAVSYGAGEVTTAAVNRMAMTLFITVLNQLQRWLFAPLGQALFSISIVSAVCTQIPLGSFTGAVKKLFMTLFTFMLLIYSFVYGIQNTLARSADSLGLRTVKFALGSFVPIVGGTISDAFAAVREGLGYVKIMTGIGGIVILLCMVLPTAVSVWTHSIVLSCSHTAAELLGCGQSAKILADTHAILQLFSALIWVSVTFFLFAIILFTKTAVHAS